MLPTYGRLTENVSAELKDLQATKENQDHGLTMTEAIRNLRRREIRTPFLLIFTSYLFVMWSGPVVIMFYAVEIFEKAGVSTTNQYLAAIIAASVRQGELEGGETYTYNILKDKNNHFLCTWSLKNACSLLSILL